MRFRAIFLALIGVASTACAPSGIGDPCLPSSGSAEGATAVCNGQPCFSDQETYIETRSLECRTRVCLVNGWNQVNDPGGRNAHAYCSAHCESTSDCPDGFACTQLFEVGDPGVIGSYCVRAAAE